MSLYIFEKNKSKYPNYKITYTKPYERYSSMLVEVCNHLDGKINTTKKDIAEKYDYSLAYVVLRIKRISKLKYKPKIINNKLVCSECGEIKDTYYHIHHNHNTGKYIGIVCASCNNRLKNNTNILINGEEYKKKNAEKKPTGRPRRFTEESASIGVRVPISQKDVYTAFLHSMVEKIYETGNFDIETVKEPPTDIMKGFIRGFDEFISMDNDTFTKYLKASGYNDSDSYHIVGSFAVIKGLLIDQLDRYLKNEWGRIEIIKKEMTNVR